MLTVVAYLVTVILGQFAFKIGIIIGALAILPINLLLDLLFSEKFSENIRLTAILSAVFGFIGGIFASFVCVAFGYLVFTFIAGSGTFGVFPFFASVASMASQYSMILTSIGKCKVYVPNARPRWERRRFEVSTNSQLL